MTAKLMQSNYFDNEVHFHNWVNWAKRQGVEGLPEKAELFDIWTLGGADDFRKRFQGKISSLKAEKKFDKFDVFKREMNMRGITAHFDAVRLYGGNDKAEGVSVPGVYVWRAYETILYVGRSWENVVLRSHQSFNERLVPTARSHELKVGIIYTRSKAAAEILEIQLIHCLQPRLNANPMDEFIDCEIPDFEWVQMNVVDDKALGA